MLRLQTRVMLLALASGLHVAPMHQRLAPARLRKVAIGCCAVEPIDPRDAVKELSKLSEQVVEVWTDGKTWTPEERTTRRRAIVDTYVRVFAPAIAFSGVQIAVALSAFGVALLVISASGYGYEDIAALASGVPLLGDALAQVGPGWGNAAIALLLTEIAAPLLLPLSALATPKATAALSAKLTEAGFDADGLNRRLEAALGESPPPADEA